ncbi:MAG: hypothetical protein HWN66_19560 [Candidatus Helarchaeota archaeon]|nr:hypothetical protein [Candidatus Helarchaeota archaeon]
MSIERRRRLRKKIKGSKSKKEKKEKRQRGNPKREPSSEEIEARKRAQRLGMFDKKKKLYKK